MAHFFIRCALVAGLLSSANVVMAAEAVSAKPVSSAVPSAAPSVAQSMVGVRAGEGFDFAALGQLLAGLVLVLVLFLALAWLVKRSGMAGGFSQGGMKVVANLPLGARERAVLVQLGDKQLLLGVAPGRVNLLESFDTPVVKPDAASQPPFSNWLKKAIDQRAASQAQAGAGSSLGGDSDRGASRE